MKRIGWALAAALIVPMVGLVPPATSAPGEPGGGAGPQAAGMRLLYSTWGNGGTRLRSVKLDGSDVKTHLGSGSGYDLGTLSPDRTRLAWTADEPDRVMLGTSTGGGAQKVLDGFAQPVAWSPDGRSVYASTSDREWEEPSRVWRIPADGGEPAQIWEGHVGETVIMRGASATHVLAETDRVGEPRFFVIPVDGGTATNYPTWDDVAPAPGSEIVFALVPKNGAYRLVRYDMSTGASSVVHTFKNKYAWYPTWSADGGRFAISGSDKRGQFILLMNRAGKAKKRISPLPKGAPAGYGSIGLSPDGKAMAYKVSSRYGSPYDGLYLRDNKRSRVCKVRVAAPSPSAVFSTDGRWIVISRYGSAIVATKKVVSKGGKAKKVKLVGGDTVVGFLGGSSKPAAIAPCGKG